MSQECYKDQGLAFMPGNRDSQHMTMKAGSGDVLYSHYAVGSAFMPYKEEKKLVDAPSKAQMHIFTYEQDRDETDLEVEAIFSSGFIPKLERHELPYIFAFEELCGDHALEDDNEIYEANIVAKRDFDYWFIDEDNVVHELMEEGLFWKD